MKMKMNNKKKNNVVKDATIKESSEKPKEIKKVLKKIKLQQIMILIGL